MYAVPDIIVKSGIMYYGNTNKVKNAFNEKKKDYENEKTNNINFYYLNTVLPEKKTNSDIMKTNLTDDNDVVGLDRAWKIVSCYRKFKSSICGQKSDNGEKNHDDKVKEYANTICDEHGDLYKAIENLEGNNKFMPSDIGNLSYDPRKKVFTLFPKGDCLC